MSAARFPRAPRPPSPYLPGGQTVGSLFAATVARQADDEMLIDGDTRLSFAEVAARVRNVAAGLRDRGFVAGDVVAYQLPNWWEAVVVFLAAAEIGATANPLLPTFREHELLFALRDSGARALFLPAVWRGFDHEAMAAALRSQLPALEHIFVVRPGPGTPASRFPSFSIVAGPASRTSAAPPHADADALLLLMYTSGTTSAPKGVLHTHETLVAEILSLARVHALGPGDRTLMPSPVTHISGVIHAILTPALLGTAAVLMDRWEPRAALRLIAGERATYMAGAPTFLQELVQQPGVAAYDLSSLRLFSCGGAAVSPQLVREARARMPNCVAKRVFGSTEFPTISTTGPDDAWVYGIDSEGKAIAPGEVRIRREDGTNADVGEEGEVQARGPECFVGYSDASLNEECFTADGWFRTGDLGTLDPHGYLRITGRLKEIIVRKGEKISVREVEEAAALHPAIREVAVIALPDTETGERACAVVALRPGASLDVAELSRHLAERGLARQKHPERLEVLAALPRTDSGKIARAALVARFSE